MFLEATNPIAGDLCVDLSLEQLKFRDQEMAEVERWERRSREWAS